MKAKMNLYKKLCILSASVALVCSANAANLVNGLAAYWTLDDGSTGTGIGAVVDAVGTDNGTIISGSGTATTGVTGVVRQGVRLSSASGTHPQINMGSNSTATSALSAVNGSFSVSIWFNVSNTKAYQTLLGFGNASSFEQGVSLILDGANGLVIRGYKGSDGNSRIGLTKSGELEANTWYNLVAVFDQNTDIVVGYLNGLGSGTTTSSTAGVILDNGWQTGGAGGTGNMIIGESVSFGTSELDLIYGRNGTSSVSLTATFDELAIWNRALSASEVQALYNEQLEGKGILEIPEPSLVTGICSAVVFVFVCTRLLRRRRSLR